MPDTVFMSHAGFVHLRLLSAYSMLEGAIQPEDIAKACRRGGFPAAGLADRGNMFAAMDFSAAAKDAGVQPIIGAMVAVERPGSRSATTRPVHDWLVLFAKDGAGYANLIALVSQAHLGVAAAEDPHLMLADFDGRTAGLLCLTGGADGALVRLLAEGQPVDAYADALAAHFPDRLYIEISRCGDAIEARAEAALLALATDRGLPIVATNPVKFLQPNVHLAHDALLCIADSAYVEAEERRRSNPEHRLKSAAEMQRAFADLPEALANSLVIARRCAVAAPARKPILPRMAEGGESEDPALIAAARAGLAKRLAARAVADPKPYHDRLEFELGVINAMGFPGYFLIVADFIGWAKAQGIPVGPGRGSGAGSVVAWALAITDLDPLEHELLFERFLNPDRVSMPDFDIDFCETRRGEVIKYVQTRYGDAQVAQIITFGKMKARAVLKDVGRVLQVPYGQTDRLSKLIPNLPADPWTLARTLGIGKDAAGKRYPGIAEFIAERDRDPKIRRLIEIALQLEGLPRHASTHAAGVVIGDRPLSELVPLYRDPRSDMAVTQFEMKAVEKAGLVKFDFLGLKTLSVLDRAAKLLSRRGVTVDWLDLPLDDPAVYALLARADTVGVFQFEGEGMRRALGQVRPSAFGDIVALGALYRPGPMDNIPSFANRKHGRESVALLHPMMEPILRETYGIIVYQEQVMQIARTLAGYSLGEADLLRRAMGKKIHAEMVAQKQRFADGAATNGIAPETASAIFDLVLKFANYGFNKSHAAAYALISFQTAWLKAHHPVEFFAASMAYDITNTDRLAAFTEDARRSGVAVLPPCINASDADFSVEGADGAGAVRYGLAALKNVGEKAMEVVVEARGDGFATLPAFARNVDPKLLNKRQLESLIASGCFDGIEPNRAGVHLLAEAILATAQSAAAARDSAQTMLFGDATGVIDEGGLAMLVPASANWTMAQTMAQEKEAFGFYFSGHPVEAWRPLLDAQGARSFAEVVALPAPNGGGRQGVVMAGLIETLRWRTPVSGKRYLLVTLSDRSGQYVASCFEDDTQTHLERLASDAPAVLVQAELLWREGEDVPRVTLRGATPLAELARRVRSRLVVTLTRGDDAAALAGLVADARGKGRCELVATVPTPAGTAHLRLAGDLLIDIETLARLGQLLGPDRVTLLPLDPPRLALVG